jgi:hypothetical protein
MELHQHIPNVLARLLAQIQASVKEIDYFGDEVMKMLGV